MKKSKKKLSREDKNKNIVLLCLLCSLIFLLIILSIKELFLGNYYKIEPRNDNINKMKSKNTDEYKVYGWIRVQGTDIDYPLIGFKSNNSSLPDNISKYAWLMQGDYKFHNVINIMGHNFMNLSSKPYLHDDNFDRFEEIMDFVYYDFAKDNKYIQLTMDGKDYLYKIFASGFIDNYDYNTLPYNEYSKDEIKKYLDIIKDNSIYKYDVNIKENDSFITLATCTRFNSSMDDDFYIAGRLVRNNEHITNYSVHKNKKYEKIEKKLKGVDVDDKEEDA